MFVAFLMLVKFVDLSNVSITLQMLVVEIMRDEIIKKDWSV